MKTSYFLKHNYNLIMSYMIKARQHSLITDKCYTVTLSRGHLEILFHVTDTPEGVDPDLQQIYQAYNPLFDPLMYANDIFELDDLLHLSCGLHLMDIVPRSIIRNLNPRDSYYYISNKYPYLMEQLQITIADIETDYVDLCRHLNTVINDLSLWGTYPIQELL